MPGNKEWVDILETMRVQDPKLQFGFRYGPFVGAPLASNEHKVEECELQCEFTFSDRKPNNLMNMKLELCKKICVT